MVVIHVNGSTHYPEFDHDFTDPEFRFVSRRLKIKVINNFALRH